MDILDFKNQKYIFFSISKTLKPLLKKPKKKKKLTDTINVRNKRLKKGSPLVLKIIQLLSLLVIKTLEIRIKTVYISQTR